MVALFVFIPALTFNRSCLASIFYTAAELLVAQVRTHPLLTRFHDSAYLTGRNPGFCVYVCKIVGSVPTAVTAQCQRM